MAALTTPYLFFNGNCKEAIAFYHSVFGGEAQVIKYGDAIGEGCPLAMRDQVIHGSVKSGGIQLSASDSAREVATPGNNLQIGLKVELADYERIFEALSACGKVEDEPQDMPWGRFSSFTDKYGFHWMMTADRPKA